MVVGGIVGKPVSFGASAVDPAGIYDPLTYEWEFGDNTTGAGSSITHLYGQPGTYSAEYVPGWP